MTYRRQEGRGAPPKLDLRLPASLACALVDAGYAASDKAAAIAAWETLQAAEHPQPREIDGETVSPKFRNEAVDRLNSITRTMRALRAGELERLAYSPHWLAEAAKRCPKPKDSSSG